MGEVNLRRRLLNALNAMPPALKADFAAGHLRSEADLQFSVVQHLRSALRREAGWLVGGNHTLHEVRPDVACYHVTGGFESFIVEPEQWLVGVIEIKFAADPTSDLRNLKRFQARSKAVAWMVYGDHFSEKIHKAYYRAQLRREAEIRRWKGNRQDRGFFILKCAEFEEAEEFRNCWPRIKSFNQNFWIRDTRLQSAKL